MTDICDRCTKVVSVGHSVSAIMGDDIQNLIYVCCCSSAMKLCASFV